MHALGDIAQGFTWKQSTSIRFFCIQALGIMFEDLAQATYIRIVPKRHIFLSSNSRFKVLGYLWVLIFLVWSTPIWIYPSIYQNNGGAKYQMVPFSLLKAAGMILAAT